jgi:hypothetical protein
MAWRLTCDQNSHRLSASIDRLMLLARGDFESFTSLKNKIVMLDFEGQFSLQHEEELTCMNV